VLFWVQAEAVNVNTIRWGMGVTSIAGLQVVEVSTSLNGESIVTVQLDVTLVDWVTLTIESKTVVVGLNYYNVPFALGR
jgi:hypothetical protein